LFNKIDDVLTAVDAVSGIEYVADNVYTEITSFGAFIIDENVDVELEKLSVNGQIYNVRMVTDWYLHVVYADYTKAQFKTLLENVIKALAATSGFNYIKIVDMKLLTPYQIGSTKTRTAFGTVEFFSKESWV